MNKKNTNNKKETEPKNSKSQKKRAIKESTSST